MGVGEVYQYIVKDVSPGGEGGLVRFILLSLRRVLMLGVTGILHRYSI